MRTNPPNKIKLIEYLVPCLVVLQIAGGNHMPNSSTFIPALRATQKCPNSCTSTSMDMTTIKSMAVPIDMIICPSVLAPFWFAFRTTYRYIHQLFFEADLLPDASRLRVLFFLLPPAGLF